MARTGFIHHIGTFFLLVATVLLIITDISAPVIADISLLKVELGTNTRPRLFGGDHSELEKITFGSFGYCIQDINPATTTCTRSHIGYDPAEVLERRISDASFSNAAHETAKDLTRVMVLHPIATALAFISFILALGAGFIGSFLAAIFAFITFIVVVIVLITDFVSFGIVRSTVNDLDNDALDASWGVAAWTTLVAAILLRVFIDGKTRISLPRLRAVDAGLAVLESRMTVTEPQIKNLSASTTTSLKA
ncbi:pali-domain-containing protein [Xylaria sp. CBS 124048]|nr:pali-domain-containing protein [Xylaria sp. CBS 124048]